MLSQSKLVLQIGVHEPLTGSAWFDSGVWEAAGTGVTAAAAAGGGAGSAGLDPGLPGGGEGSAWSSSK